MAERIYQLAKELNITSNELIDILKGEGISVSSHMSGVPAEIAEKIKKVGPVIAPEIPAPVLPVETELVPVSMVKTEHAPVSKVKIPEKIKIQIPSTITIRELSEKTNISIAQLLKDLISFGIIANINRSLSFEVASKIVEKHNLSVEQEGEIFPTEVEKEDREEEKEEDMVARPPVVTVMGHVDHGKTKLLDAIRSTSVADKEVGGITQHIGAYSVNCRGEKIVFLDTPGHEAFTAMRARGAKATDIVVLVVAADDGVMPQTIEAIHHAQAAQVPIIVAINKIDKSQADIEKVKMQLLEHRLVPEEWGGETITVPISAKLKQGIDELLEMILLQAEMLELKSTEKGLAKGIIIEAKLDSRRGAVATLLVERGILEIGKIIVAGHTFGKIKAMIDAEGNKVQRASISSPVEVFGLQSVPYPGEKFREVKSEKIARDLAEKVAVQIKKEKQETQHLTLTSLHQQIKEGKIKELNIVLKADVQGSLEAVKQSLERINHDEVIIKIIHSAVGGITENDIMLALASQALIIGFNVRPTWPAYKLQEKEKIDIRTYNIIYHLIEDIKAAIEGMLDPKYEEEVIGRGEIRKVFKVPKVGVIAGCYILEGIFSKDARARILRDEVVIYEGDITSLRRFKEDVREVSRGYECGFGILNFQDMKINDVVEVFSMREVKSPRQ